MFKVMVVEDSKRMLQHIQKQIQLVDSRLSIVKTANNGLDALRILQEEPIDILFTDIRMPMMDGLSLIKEAKKIQPLMKVFLLSGYSDFEYAQEAIRLNVCDYLLKPLNYNELSLCLNKTIQELEQRVFLNHETELFNWIYQEELQEPSGMQSDGYLLLVLRNQYFKNNEIELASEHLRLYCSDCFQDISYYIVRTEASNEKIILLGFENEQREKSNKQIEKFIHLVSSEMSAVYVAFSGVFSELKQTKELFPVLSQWLDQHIKFEGPFYWNVSNQEKALSEATNTFERQQQFRHRFYLLTKAGRKQELIRELQSYLDDYKCDPPAVNRLWHLIVFIRDTLKLMLQDHDSTNDLAKLDRIFTDCKTYDQFSERLINIVQYIFSQQLNDKSLTENTFSAIETYLHSKNYDNISLIDICQTFNYSTSYITRIFKKSVQMTPIEYYTKLKIDESIRLMKQQKSIFIKDIAEQLCFSDQHYFSKVFRQFTGVSPTTFKNKLMDTLDQKEAQ